MTEQITLRRKDQGLRSLAVKLLCPGAEGGKRNLGKLCFQSSQEAPPLASFFSSSLRSFPLGKRPGKQAKGRPTLSVDGVLGCRHSNLLCLPWGANCSNSEPLCLAPLPLPLLGVMTSQPSGGGRQWVPVGLGPAAFPSPRDTSPNLPGKRRLHQL